jgi:hypothetical protein
MEKWQNIQIFQKNWKMRHRFDQFCANMERPERLFSPSALAGGIPGKKGKFLKIF